jgi:cytochrome P450
MHMIESLKLKMGEAVDIAPYMQRAMFRSLIIAIFDLPEMLVGDRDQETSKLMNRLFQAVLNPLFLVAPFLDRPWFPGRGKYFAESAELNRFIQSIIDQKREQLVVEEGDDVVDRDLVTLMLKESMDPTSAKISDDEMIGNVKALFFAGHETTATALTTVMHLLAVHQDVQDKVREEVFCVLGGKPGEMVTPTPDQQRQLEYLNAVVREGQRLFAPSGRLMNRYTSQVITLPDGTVLSKGTSINMDVMSVLRSDKIWSDPDAFKPERHLGESREGRSSTEFFTFSAGRRICPGMNLATLEERVMLALWVQVFKWELADPVKDKDVRFGSHYLLKPKNTVLKLHLLQ